MYWRLERDYDSLAILCVSGLTVLLQWKLSEWNDRGENFHEHSDCLRIILCDKNVRADFVFGQVAVHEIADHGQSDVHGCLRLMSVWFQTD